MVTKVKLVSLLLAMICIGNFHAQEWLTYVNQAREAYRSKNFTKALSFYVKAKATAPKNINLKDEIAQTYYRSKKYGDAEKSFQSVAQSKKGPLEKSRSFHNLGNARMEQKNYQGAIDAYKEALRNNPNDETTRYNLSEAIRRLKKDQPKPQPDQQNKQDQSQNNTNNKKNQPNKSPKQNNAQTPEKSTLPKNAVDKLLDQLTKAEAETKRKMGNGKAPGNDDKSSKDW